MKVVKVFVKQDPSMDLAKYKVRGFVRAWETTGRCACREPAGFLAPCWPRAPPVGGVSPVCVGMAGVALCAFGFSSGCLCRLLATGQSRMAAQGAARQRQRLLFRGERAAGFFCATPVPRLPIAAVCSLRSRTCRPVVESLRQLRTLHTVCQLPDNAGERKGGDPGATVPFQQPV